MLMADSHAGKRYSTRAHLRPNQGREREVVVIKRGPARTRVGELARDGTVKDHSWLVPNAELSDFRPIPQNLKRRFMSHHAGMSFPERATIRWLDEDQKFVVQRGVLETRLIDIDGRTHLSRGESYVVPTSEVEFQQDELVAHVPIDERGVMIVPITFRQQLGMLGNSTVELHMSKDGESFDVRQVKLARRQ